MLLASTYWKLQGGISWQKVNNAKIKKQKNQNKRKNQL